MKNYSVAIVGATGLVGRTMSRVLLERQFPVGAIKFLASARSAGAKVEWAGDTYSIEELTDDSFEGVDFALFSAGGEASKRFAPAAANAGCIVIDNSSAWRMHPDVPLVVPEVNPQDLHSHQNIIANPNCSTIQLVVALKPLHDALGLRRVVVSTYQSVSGAGQKGIDQLADEIAGREPVGRISPHTLAYNTVFHGIAKGESFSEEEIKVKRETRKILHLPDLHIGVTCVRLPVLGGHGESVNIETITPADAEDIREILTYAPGIEIIDDPARQEYPMTLLASGMDSVYVGRIRRDDSVENGFHLWIVADNVRKGAATNAVQIAEALVQYELR